MHIVTDVKYLADYRLKVSFNTGESKEVNLESYLEGEMFEPLRDRKLFQKVQINPDVDTICWENGADLAPEFLYEIGK